MLNDPDFFLLYEKPHPDIDYLSTRVYHDRKNQRHDDWGVHLYLPSKDIPKNNLEMETAHPEIQKAVDLAESKLYNQVILHDKTGPYQDYPTVKEPKPVKSEDLKKSEILEKADMPPIPPPQTEMTTAAPNISVHVPEALKHLAVMESTNHTYRVHPVVKAGIHKNTQSISSYGLMPKYIQEVAKKYLPLSQSSWGTHILKASTPQDVSKITEDQQADTEIASHIWNYNQSRISHNLPSLSDEEKELVTVLSHRRGINSALETYKINGIEGVKKDPYVTKYLKLKSGEKQ